MFLATDLSFLSQLNLIFYVILGFAILIGFARGLKKTLFSFITMVIFYVVFFLTINMAVNFLWTVEMPWLGQTLSNVDSSLSGFTSFEGSLDSLIQVAIGGDTIDLASSSEAVIALATGLFQFALKIVWTVLYFTVILLIYKLICLIIRAIFFKTKKGASKNHGLGALIGALNGVMALFVFMIVLGGVMSVTESVTVLLDSAPDATTLSYEGSFRGFDSDFSVIPMTTTTTELNTYVEDLQGMVDGYNNNLFVKLANNITTASSINAEVEVPLHIDLFDRVLSFDYEDTTIGLRYELAVFSVAAAVILESDFIDSNEITDITGDEIRDLFSELSHSELLVGLMPVAIEMAADIYEQDLDIEMDDLYAIDFETELANLGSIAGGLFDILNGAGFIGGSGSVDQITIDGDAVRDIFEDVAGSDVILLITESLLFPMLEEQEGGFSAIITVPDTLDIEAEYLALGEIFAEIIDADISFSDFENADVGVLLNAVAEVDLLVLLESQLVTEALINILSGNTEIEGLDILTIPSGIEWRDVGAVDGELRKVLTALNSFIDSAGDLDFDNLDVNTLTDLSDQAIDDFFGSYIIRATISDIISETALGDVLLTIPDSVYDSLGYLTETELVSVVQAVKLILTDVGSDFDILQALDLTDSDMDTLLASDILHATIGKELYDLGASTLVIPSTAEATVVVDSLNQIVISKTEIKSILKALNVLDISNLDTMSFDAAIMSNLENVGQTDLDDTKINTLLGSEIVHATVSDMILDLDGGVLEIPTLDPLGVEIRFTENTLEYISVAEIGNILKALYRIDITNFNSIDFEDTSLLLSNMDDLLISGIIHATVSQFLLDLAPLVTIPERDSTDSLIIISQGSTRYIDSDEISNMLDVLDYLGMSDPTSFTSSFDLTQFDDESEQNLLLSSAIMHASISKIMFDLSDDGIFIIPEDNELDTVEIIVSYGSVGHETDYVVKDEIKAMINALNVMGLAQLNSISAEISASSFLDNSTIILDSSSLQATLSEQILSAASADIIIPDSVKTTVGTVNYVNKVELQAFMDSVNTLGGDNFDTFSFVSNDIFGVADLDTFFNSKILQASVSTKILPNATTELTATANTLIVPIFFREAITVESVGDVMIEKTELVNLLESLDALAFDFTGSVSGDVFTGMTGPELDTVLESGSMHITFNYMLQNNAALTIPNKALVGEVITGEIYDVANVVIATEIRDFILAALQLSGDINGAITFADITGLSQAERDVAITSMIVRTIITDDLTAAMALNGTPFIAADYVSGSAPQFLLYSSAKSALDTLY